MEEQFKELPEFPGYQIGNKGTILGKKGMPLSLRINEDGYYRLSLHINLILKTINIHRLLALAWIPNPNNEPCVDHINRNKQDNRVENLRWVSRSKNSENKEATHISLTQRGYYRVKIKRHGIKYRRSFKEQKDALAYLESIKTLYPV
jgi:hypothetical protein